MDSQKIRQIDPNSLDIFTNYNLFLGYIKQKISNASVRKHTENISWMFFAKIGSMIISFLATAYIARNLGPGNYGELSYAISFVMIFSFFASLGIDQILYRDLIKYPEKKNEYLGSAIVLRLFASIAGIFFCLISAIIISPKDVSLFLIFIISLTPLVGSFQLLSYEFFVESKSKYPSILALAVVLVLNILKIAVILFGKGVIYLALITLLEPILYSLGYIYLKHKVYKDLLKMRFDKQVALSILKDSYPLVFVSAFYVVYSRIDQVMIKNMIDSASVGLYDSAVRISEVSYFVPSILISALFPAIINAQKVSTELYYSRIRKLFLLLIVISVIIALGTTILSKQLILIIFGAGFMGALPVLCIYVWSNIGATLNMLTQQILVAENMTKNISITIFFGALVNIALNLMLIPYFGISGAAFASLISYLIPFASLLLFKDTRKIVISMFSRV